MILAIPLGAPCADVAAEHWAFLPPAPPALPAVRRSGLARGAIDRFLEAALEEKGLALGVEACREVLIRRLSFDLTGLPPAPQEVEAFVADPAPDAYERLVDRLLASPRFGERWGRHWLDAAGYADSNGYFNADSDRPIAYKYRDYVVRALNADKPFDRFIQEQLAGDELVGFDPDGDVLPEMVDALAATHFLRNAQDGTGESDGNPVEVLVDKTTVIEGTIQIIGSSLLGLTLQCAKCHDHKFDPVTQADYYGLQAILAPAYSVQRWTKPQDRLVTVGTREEKEAHRLAVEKVDREIEAERASLEGAAAPLKRLLQREKAAALQGSEGAELVKALEAPGGKRTDEQKALLERHEKLLAVDDEALDRRFETIARLRDGVKEAIEQLERSKPAPLERLSVLVDTDFEPPPHHVLTRGLVTEPGAEVAPGVPAVLETSRDPYTIEAPKRPGRSSGRRLAFARWLTSPENPLLLRVSVNRLWQHHFGAGIVATPENFGKTGAPPTSPALLDHLATELVARGWSLKALHREVVTSAAYRQSSAPRAEGMAADPENRLLWKFPLRRLDAEELRDGLLAVAGSLDLRMGGPPVPFVQADDGQVLIDERKDGALRRSIYLRQRRTQPVAQLETFDAPLIVTSCTRRAPSTTPLQSLAMLNSAFILERARGLARRAMREVPATPAARLERAWRLALARGPSDEEGRLGIEFLEAQAREYGGDEGAELRAFTDLCQMLLASSAFLYVE